MAIKKDAPIQKLMDPAVEAVLNREQGDSTRRDRAQAMTPGQRKKAMRDRKRNRATYDLPVELEAMIDNLAQRLSVPKSEVATWLMIRGLEHTTMNDLVDARTPSRSMRYEYVLEIPDVPRSIEK